MKSSGVRLEAIAAPDALLAAWRAYRSGKRRRPAVARFEMRCEERLLTLSQAVLEGSYRHGPYRLLEIYDPKPRLIAVARVEDRVLHRSIYDRLAPRFNRSLIADTYACLPGRGSHRAVLRFLELQRRFGHLMHLDVERYFPSVDHELLLDLLAPRLRDRRVIDLLAAVLASGAELYRRPPVAGFYGFDRGELSERPRGLPIGNLTSQWWGNLYLDALDQFIKRVLGARGYLRYMDDLVCFADEPATLRAWRSEIRDWLWEKRCLRLNLRKGHVRPATLPHPYLGYRVTRQGIDVGPKALRRFRRKLGELATAGDPERLRRSLAAWRGAVGFPAARCS